MRDHHEFDSPVDIPEDDTGAGHPLAWTTLVLLVASLVLLFTNAVAIRDWVDEQTPGPYQARLAEIAAGWEQWTADVGLGTPRAALHDRWKAVQAARFEDDQR